MDSPDFKLEISVIRLHSIVKSCQYSCEDM